VTDGQPLLVVLAGRPGTGKSTLAKRLAMELHAAYIRLDAIVIPVLDAGLADDESRAAQTGYEIARGVARENLEIGVPVIVDGLHAAHARRHEWLEVAASTGAQLEFLETYLNDEREHRRRVEQRTGGESAYPGPSWDNIQTMAYEPWDETRSGERLALETSDADSALAAAISHLHRRGSCPSSDFGSGRDP
jgi:predicted kinase